MKVRVFYIAIASLLLIAYGCNQSSSNSSTKVVDEIILSKIHKAINAKLDEKNLSKNFSIDTIEVVRDKRLSLYDPAVSESLKPAVEASFTLAFTHAFANSKVDYETYKKTVESLTKDTRDVINQVEDTTSREFLYALIKLKNIEKGNSLKYIAHFYPENADSIVDFSKIDSDHEFIYSLYWLIKTDNLDLLNNPDFAKDIPSLEKKMDPISRFILK